LQDCSLHAEHTQKRTIANEYRAGFLEKCTEVAGGGPSDKDLHGQRWPRRLLVQRKPAMPRTNSTVPLRQKLRMAPPPHHLPERFLRARPPVRANTQVALPLGPQHEDSLAKVVPGNLDEPSPHKP
jgi:hypothetical protein